MRSPASSPRLSSPMPVMMLVIASSGSSVEELGAVVAVGVGRPGVDQRLQMGDQQVGATVRYCAAPIGVGGVDVVGHGAGAGAVLADRS